MPQNDSTFDYAAARKAGYSDGEIQTFLHSNYGFNFDITSAKKSGYSDNEINQYLTSQTLKKKVGGSVPTSNQNNGSTNVSTQESDLGSGNPILNFVNSGKKIEPVNSDKYGLGVDVGMKPVDTKAIKDQEKKTIQKAAENTVSYDLEKSPTLKSLLLTHDKHLPSITSSQESFNDFFDKQRNDISLINEQRTADKLSIKNLKNIPYVQQKVAEKVDAYNKGDLALTNFQNGDKAGEPVFTRPTKGFEAFGDAIVNSYKATKDAFATLGKSDKDVADYLDKQRKDLPEIPVSKETGTGAMVGNAVGGMLKPTAEFVGGEAAAPEGGGLIALSALETPTNAFNKTKELYYESMNKLKQQYGDNIPESERLTAVKRAREGGFLQALPNTAMQLYLFKGVGGAAENQASKTFLQSIDKAVQGTSTMALLGTGAEATAQGIKNLEGYNTDDSGNKVAESALNWATIDGAFRLLHLGTTATKYAVSAAKERLMSAPPEVVQKMSEEYVQSGLSTPEQEEQLRQDLQKYEAARGKVAPYVPAKDISSYAGLQQKRDNLQSELDQTQESKISPEFKQNAVNILKARISDVDNQIKTMMASNKDAIEHEQDNLSTYEEPKKKEAEVPISKGVEGSNINNESKSAEETSTPKESNGEDIQSQQSRENVPNELGNNDNLNENKQENIPNSPTENLKTNSIVEDKTEIPKVEDKPIEQKVEDNRVISKQDFHDNVLNMAEGMKNSEFEWRVTIPEMSQKDREKAVADIRAGKDSKQAQKLKAFIDDAYDKNTITLNRGRGNQAQTVEYPLKEWFGEPLKNDKFDYAVNKLDDNSASIIKDENITPENIDNLKHLFNGFPYDKTDFQNIKDYFAGQDKSNAEVGSVSSQSEASQAEKIISQTNKEQPIASTNEDEGNVSGVKKDITEPLRSGLNLPKVELPKMGSDTENIHAAKARVDSGESNPLNLVDRILTDKDGFRNENEVFDMQYYGHQLKQQETDLKARYAEAETEQEKAAISGQVQQLSDEVDRFTEASQTALNKWGKIGNAAQVIIDEGFNPSREKLFIKDAYGGEIPKDVNAKIDAIAKERDAALTALKIVEEKLKKVEAEKALNKLKKSADKNKGDIAKLKDEAEELKQQLRQAFKKDLGNINAGIPIPKETLEVLGKLAINYLKQGALTVDAIVNKIYDDLKDEIKEPFTKKDVRDWLINTADIVRETETAKLNRKAEGVENKVTPTVLDKKGKPTEQQQFIKPKSQVNTFQNNSEWVRANQRVINAEYKMKVLKRQAFESQKNMFQKGLMWAGRLTRLSVLSGYNVLYKLAAASTIGGAIKRIPEQAIGGIYSKIFKGIAEKAPIEGYFNAKSEAKFYKEFFNPKKFVHNSWEILKTGESDLSKKFSTGKYEHVKGLYLPTDLHQVIKDPLKRATFESSFRNALIHAEKNGLDINDPLIINSIESAAFKRANYEIFQEQNALTKKFNAWKSQLEKSGNVGALGKFVADFLVPVSTVPTNIVRRLVSTSPLGLIRGSAKVIEAYRSGIESLSNEQADAVMRQLKQGSLGTALWLIGWFGYSHYGGLYSKYDPNKTRKEGELASDEMEVNGQQIPKPVQHALPLEIIQWAATARRIYENYSDNKNSGLFESIYNAGMGSIGALTEQIPIIEEVGHLTGAASEPYEAKKLKEDVTRRFEPQILRETGVIKSETTTSSTNPKPLKRQTLKKPTLQKLSR